MSERIKELYLKSLNDNQEFCYQRFAKLVVKECTGLLWNESERLYEYSSECNNERHSDEAELSAEKCLDNIKMLEEHFGIES
jgi:hypothetical protein